MGDWADDHALDYGAHLDQWSDEPEPDGAHSEQWEYYHGCTRSSGQRGHNLQIDACMTEVQANTFGRKRFWWILDRGAADRGVERPFVDFGGMRPATAPLSVALVDGLYLVGAGPAGHFRREIVVVGGVVKDPEAEVQRIPCVTVGCEGVIEYQPGNPPPKCEPFDLSPPRERLCGACRSPKRRALPMGVRHG